MKKKQSHLTSSKAVIQTLKRSASRDQSPMNQGKGEAVVGIFEREFDVSNMTAKTIENLFKAMDVKPDKVMKAQIAA